MKTVIVIAFCFLSILSHAQIHHSLVVSPANITSNDPVYIEGRVRFSNGCFAMDSSFTVIDNNIEFKVCYYYGWTIGTLLSYDTIKYKIGPLQDGTYNVRYVIYATEDPQYTHCEQFDRIDSTVTSFMVGFNSISNMFVSNTLYPNPATHQLTIQTTGYNSSYQLTTTTGQLLMQGSVTQPNFTIDVSTLPPGLYFVQLTNGSQRAVRKFVKQ